MAVVGDIVEVEKIREVELPGVNIQAAHRQRREHRERSAVDADRVVAERNHFAIPEPRQVGRRAQAGIADGIDVGEAGQAERLA